MPKLAVLGRKMMFAGDDLKTVMIYGLMFRGIQWILSVPLLAHSVRNKFALRQRYDERIEICLERDEYTAFIGSVWSVTILFISLAVALSAVGLIMFSSVYVVSGWGTPTDTKPRKPLKYLCILHQTGFTALRAINFVIGLHLIGMYYQYCECSSVSDDDDNDNVSSGTSRVKTLCVWEGSTWDVLFYATLICHSIDTVYAAYLGVLILRVGHVPHLAVVWMDVQAQWEVCCKCCFGCLSCMTCCANGGLGAMGRGNMQQFARILADNFDGQSKTVDVAVSDLLAAIYTRRLSDCLLELRAKERFRAEYQQFQQQLKKGNQENNNNEEAKVARIVTYKENLNHLMEDIKRNTHIDALHLSFLAKQFLSRGVSEVSGSKEESNDNDLPKLPGIFDLNNPEHRYLVAEGARYVRFAEAIYEWSSKDRESLWSKAPMLIQGSDHTKRALQVAPIDGVADDDIVHARYKQGITATPYAIVLDHAWQAVVVTIRGTVSLEDILTDVSAIPVELTSIGERCGFDGTGRYCHSGFLARTEWIFNDLQKLKILESLLLDEKSKYNDYRLRVTGHSLGAGIAVLLSLMLRPKFESVRCTAISPPGCTACESLAEECSAWTTSYVVETDIIARSSPHSLANLRDELLELICRIKVPKQTIFSNRNLDRFAESAELEDFLSKALFGQDEIPPSKFHTQLETFREYQNKRTRDVVESIPLKPPGRIVHLLLAKKIATKAGLLARRDPSGVLLEVSNVLHPDEVSYTARWATREELSRIVMSTHFLSDHKLISSTTELHHLAEMFKLEKPYFKVLEEPIGF